MYFSTFRLLGAFRLASNEKFSLLFSSVEKGAFGAFFCFRKILLISRNPENPCSDRMRYFLALLLIIAALPANAAVIFMYHRFGEGEYPSTNVTLEQFEAQLDFLQRENFQVWPLPKLARHLQDGRALPDKVVVITIDDAYESVFQHAFPMLQRRAMPFTVFVATDPVDQQIAGYMSWEQLRELHRAGVTLANHGASHDYLVRREAGESEAQWTKRVAEDVAKGQARLQAEVGAQVNEAPRLFAYPFGEYDTGLADIVRAQAYIAFGQHSGAVGALSDLRALPRFPVNERYGVLSDFSVKAASMPLPVLTVEPWNPRVESALAPSMMLMLGESEAQLDRLACYFEGREMQVERLAPAPRAFRISADATLPVGRSRYNCTAPHRTQSRWYWYSHPWLRQ